MCLGMPGQIVGFGSGAFATVNIAGVERTIDTSLLDDVHEGDWVVVHVGFALSKIDPDDAHTALQMFEVDHLEIGQATT
jgi:hydrogenase expression/formation protein HypC